MKEGKLVSNPYFKDLARHRPRAGWSYHHTTYRPFSTANGHRPRYSVAWIEGIYVPKWIHVPVLHRLLGGGDRVSTQRFGDFPNIAQRAAHWILRPVCLPIYLLLQFLDPPRESTILDVIAVVLVVAIAASFLR
jgi:hypothetical protein